MAKQKSLTLPPVVCATEHPVGSYSHVIRAGTTETVTGVSAAPISARRTEQMYSLSNGENIIVTSRSRIKLRPAEAHGVLRIKDTGEPHWLWHRSLEEFSGRISQKGCRAVSEEISATWNGRFNYQAEVLDNTGSVVQTGLRPPQIGGLHAIGAHWSIYHQPATVVMPTGTGKTETMLATLAAFIREPLLIVVPSKVLRDQTARKFATFGLLRTLGNLHSDAVNPIVGIMARRPRDVAELDLLERCNVIITTMSAINDGTAAPLVPEIAARIGALVVDEAHHIGAEGWAAFREQFTAKKVLQFTATPYRRDGKLVDGKVIYSYPLQRAQQDGYFKKITLEPVYEIDEEQADSSIAATGIARLRTDIAAGLDHRLMARCEGIDRARIVFDVYSKLAADLHPVIVHSEVDAEEKLADLRSGKSRIVVCVNMLGEGFDLPQLKIAAVHDTHKSLAVLLQFTGRFTRSAGANIGDATVIANIADAGVSSALERLYSEDADWNQLLSELSSEAAKAHAELIEFLSGSQRLDETTDDDKTAVSHQLLRPTLSTVVFDAPSFQPKKFFEGIGADVTVYRVWLHGPSNTPYFVTRSEPPVQWTRSRSVKDRQWDLFVMHWNKDQQLLYPSSSDRNSTHDHLAKAVGARDLISGDRIFRILGNINRLVFQNIGVRKHGRRNLSFALYTGADVAEALTVSERAGSVKSNLSGMGWEGGKPITIGCSYKGRIWSRDVGTIPEFVGWCSGVGLKLKDASIDTGQIISNVLIPEEVNRLPDKQILGIDWPHELLRQAEERVTLRRHDKELPIYMFDLELISADTAASSIAFQLIDADGSTWGEYSLTVGGTNGFEIQRTSWACGRVNLRQAAHLP